MATENCTLWGRTSRADLTFSRRFPQGVSGRTQGAERPESGPKRVARLPGRIVRYDPDEVTAGNGSILRFPWTVYPERSPKECMLDEKND